MDVAFTVSSEERLPNASLLPARRKLKLVRKGQRAQWKLKVSPESDPSDVPEARLPRVESLVAPKPQPYAASGSVEDKSSGKPSQVRVLSSTSVETKVCVQGHCQIVSGN